MIILANTSIDCPKDNLIILNSQRETMFDFCQYSALNSQNIGKFSTEDYYVIIKITMTKSSKLFALIYLHLIDYNQPVFSTLSSTKSTLLTTKNFNHSFESFFYKQSKVFFLILILGCGITSYIGLNSARIIGGSTAAPNSWPWQVYLSNGAKFCGGTLLNDEWFDYKKKNIYQF